MLRLRSFEELSAGSELPILPAGDAVVGTQFVEFPVASDGLSPVAVQIHPLNYPRFSAFQFREAILCGFRLYSMGADFFNDLSLVDPGPANDEFIRKMRDGYTEGLQYDSGKDTICNSVPTSTIDCAGCLVLCSDEPASFGSSLYRLLPKLVLLQKIGPVDRAMVFAELPWIADLLKTFCAQIEIIPHLPHKTYRLLNPNVPSLASSKCYHRHEIQEALEPFIEKADREVANTPDKIYISRRKMALSHPGHRVLENETELAERLILHGFQEVFPEDRTPLEQIAIFSRARIIVSVGGSNLFGCYFARRAEIIVDLEASEVFLELHTNVLASCNLPFSIVRGVRNQRGRHAHHMNWTIDVNALMEGLGRMGVIS